MPNFPILVAPFYIPNSSMWGFQFPTSSSKLSIVSHFNFSGCLVRNHNISLWFLIYIFLITNDLGLIGCLYTFSCKISVQLFCPFKNLGTGSFNHFLNVCLTLLLLISGSVVSDSVSPWTAALQVSLSFTNSWSLLRLMSIESVRPCNHLILCCPLRLLLNLSQHQGLFKWVSSLHRVENYWSFSFSISPSNEYSGLISFRIDLLGLFAVQGTLRSLLQHHNSKASILQHSVFFMVQVSHPYMSTGKTVALTRWTFVSKVMSLFPLFLHLFVMKWWDQMPWS